MHTSTTTITTPFLIVGAGPAGASLACFLAFHGKFLGRCEDDLEHWLISLLLLGLSGLMVSQDPSNADTPRAHVTNMPAIGESRPSTSQTDSQ